MKKLLSGIIGFALLAFASCNEAPKTEPAASPDYDTFNKKVEVIRAFYKAQCAEDTTALAALIADSLKYSPPYYNGNKWLRKQELLAALKAYHANYENIKFIEGIVTPDSTAGGFYSGSVFPKESATSSPNLIRTYGTWTATHTKTKQNVGLKFYSLTAINKDGKIISYSDYFDINSLMPK